MFAVLCDPAIYEFENEPPPSVEWLRARFAKLESRRSPDGEEQWLNWVVRLPSSELVERYQVRRLWAVLKRANLRSMRLLGDLGFSLASPEQHAKRQVEQDEVLMRLDARPEARSNVD
jgi:hypothetical protein